MEKDLEYRKDLERIQENVKWLESLKKEESLLRRTLESLKASPLKDEDLILDYEVDLKINLQSQDGALAGIKCVEIRWGLAILAKEVEISLKQIEEQKKTQQPQASDSQTIPPRQNTESTGIRPILAYDRSSPIHSSSVARTDVAKIQDDKVKEMGSKYS